MPLGEGFCKRLHPLGAMIAHIPYYAALWPCPTEALGVRVEKSFHSDQIGQCNRPVARQQQITRGESHFGQDLTRRGGAGGAPLLGADDFGLQAYIACGQPADAQAGETKAFAHRINRNPVLINLRHAGQTTIWIAIDQAIHLVIDQNDVVLSAQGHQCLKIRQ